MTYTQILDALRAGQPMAPTEIEATRRAAGVPIERLISDLTAALSERERCPRCGRVTPIRTSKPVENGTKRRRYYECECTGEKTTWSRTFEEK